MGIRDFIERWKSKKEKFKEFEEEQKMIEKFQEKRKSANERELERFMKEEREDNIKKELEEFRAKRQAQAQYGNQILKAKNLFEGGGNEILNNPNIFSANSIKTERSIFFK